MGVIGASIVSLIEDGSQVWYLSLVLLCLPTMKGQRGEPGDRRRTILSVDERYDEGGVSNEPLEASKYKPVQVWCRELGLVCGKSSRV